MMMDVEPTAEQQESLALLDKIESLIDLERSLTDALERAEPLLDSTATLNNKARVRPIPANLQEAEQVLAVARGLSGRTSAPAGWNPNLPVVGFATPNPLPHQLRGGALGTLQLERAKQEQKATTQRKRLKQQEEEQKEAKQKTEQKDEQRAVDNAASSSKPKEPEQPVDPKRREVVDHERQLDRSLHGGQPRKGPPKPPVLTTTMNLSDSSSSSEDESD